MEDCCFITKNRRGFKIVLYKIVFTLFSYQEIPPTKKKEKKNNNQLVVNFGTISGI